MPAAEPLHLLLLAAGNASRFGSAKQCSRLDGVSLARRAALVGLAIGADTIVVTGAHAELVTAELTGLPLTLLHNPDWAQGMGTSIACGFRYLMTRPGTSAATLVCLVDQPLIAAAELQRLIDAHRETPQRIVASDHGTVLGPPCLFPKLYYEELAQLTGAMGARRLLDRHVDQLNVVAMPQAAVDIDTPADYERLLRTRTVP
jgi:CTP:molybdopterin cytidylyltransferase MocA